jgi:hypothetical protein
MQVASAAAQPSRPWPSLDAVGLVFLYAQLAAALWIVPEWSPSHLGEPTFLAGVSGVLTSLALIALRWLDVPRWPIERALLALFLGGMPFVYVASWMVAPQPGWLPVELLGVAIFVPLALLGWWRSPWFLAGGIAAHGLMWDLWHFGHSSYIPDWYAIGCLVADVGIGVYAATTILQLPAEASGPARGRRRSG